MSDYADKSKKIIERELERIIEDQKAASKSFEDGHPGYCDSCYAHKERVVTRGRDQYCARCRDKLGLD